MDIDIAPGLVRSRVQGSRHTPYRVEIHLRPLQDSQWATVLDALAGQAIFAAQLLNGEMPADVEEVFEAVRVPLFPASRGDLETDCTCPDWANPCKHIAAVYYLLGERFDEDPFLLFELRGRDQEAIAAGLRERRAVGVASLEPAPYTPTLLETLDVPALEECLDRFWTLGPEAADLAFNIAPPQVPSALLKRVGIPDFDGVNPRNFQRQMERVYEAVTDGAVGLAFAESGELG
jgi:uncharacterized Zn finger protein